MSPRRVVTTSCAKVCAKPSRAARTDPPGGGGAADQRHQRRPYQFLEQRFLVLEMQVDGALGDAGAFGDVVEPRRRKAARDEFVQRRLDDGLAALRRACRTAG